MLDAGKSLSPISNEVAGGIKLITLTFISGVDYRNPILGGCFGPDCHISLGYDFVGGTFDGTNSPVYNAAGALEQTHPSIGTARLLAVASMRRTDGLAVSSGTLPDFRHF